MIDYSKVNILTRLGRAVGFKCLYQAYSVCFRQPAGLDYVLPDLLEFTGALDPAPRSNDLFEQGRAAGRRDVWLRVQEHIRLTEDELFAVYQGRASMRKQDFQRR